MNDRELDELIRGTSPVSAGRIASLDLRGAQSELMETIMAIPDTDLAPDAEVQLGAPPPDGPTDRRRPRAWFAVAAAAAAALVAFAAVQVVGGDDQDPEVLIESPAAPAELPRLLFREPPAPMTLANVDSHSGTGDEGAVVGGEEPFGVVTEEGDGPVASHEAYYSEPVPGDDGLAYLTVNVMSADDESVLRVGPGGREVTVRGHAGRIESSEIPGGSFGPLASIELEWEEAPGVLVHISVTNSDVTEEALLAAAETLYEASDEEWAQAQHLNDMPTPEDVAALVPADAQASVTIDLKGAAVYLAEDGQVCTTAVDGRGQFPVECADPDGTRASLFKDRIGFPSVLYGVLPDGATKVVATRGGVDIEGPGDVGPPPPQSVFLDPTADGSRTLFAISVAAMMPPDLLTFVDAQGQPVETVPLDIKPDL